MALMLWAIDVPHIPKQKDAKMKVLANLLKQDKIGKGLQSVIRLHEQEIASNRESP